jgi:hypothetical protein
MILCFQAEPWRILNKDTGELEREGYTLTYVDLDSPHQGRKRGYEPLRVSGTPDVVMPVLAHVPGFLDARFRQRANRDTGKVELQLSHLAFVAPLPLPDGYR